MVLSYGGREDEVMFDGEGVVLEPIVSKTAIGWRRGVEEEEVYMICEGHDIFFEFFTITWMW